jgi:dihydroneopterin aldolase
MAIIAIEGMQFYAYHGVYQYEKETGAHYTVDVYVTTDISQAAQSDQVNHTINYERIFDITSDIMQVPTHLIEKVCIDILQKVKNTFEGIDNLRVRVTKHNPPIKGRVEKVSVEESC